MHSSCAGLASPQAHSHRSDHETQFSDPARCHTLRDSTVPRPPPAFRPCAHTLSLFCFCPSSAGRGQGWDSSLCTSLLSLLGSPQPQHCIVTRAHTLHFTTLPLTATHPTLGKPACMRENPNTTNPSCFLLYPNTSWQVRM